MSASSGDPTILKTTTPLCSLICHRDIAQSITCLGSLTNANVAGLQLVFHEDGSLTGEDADRLRVAFPDCRIVWRRDADQQMAETLRHHPRCQAFRAGNVFALKLLDTPLLGDGERCHYCDGDILFLRPSTGLFEIPDPLDAVFMMDAIEPVAWTFKELWQRKLAFVGRVNAGMYSVRRRVLDLDKLEWFLGFEMAPHLRHVQEQTAWAWLASGFTAAHWDPAVVRVVSNDFPVTASLAAAHFIGMYRSQLPAGLALLRETRSEPADPVNFALAGRFTWSSKFGLVARRLARRLGHRPAGYS